MALINTITNNYAFWDWLQKSDNYKNNFTLEGAKALQAYIEELSDELNETIEFDPIAWCCSYSEYDDIHDYNKQHLTEFKNFDELRDYTNVILLEDNKGAIVEDY